MKGKFGLKCLRSCWRRRDERGTGLRRDWKRGPSTIGRCAPVPQHRVEKTRRAQRTGQGGLGAYIKADKHGKNTVSSYCSKQYRDSIKSKNAAARNSPTCPRKTS